MAVTPKIVTAVTVGFVVLFFAAIFRAYEGPIRKSIKPGHGNVDYWKWNFLNYWYANTEDGCGLNAVLGTEGPYYRDTFPKGTPDWVIVYCWSAWRNSANNVKRWYRFDTWLPKGAPSVWPL
jgi:hypothetical protein